MNYILTSTLYDIRLLRNINEYDKSRSEGERVNGFKQNDTDYLAIISAYAVLKKKKVGSDI